MLGYVIEDQTIEKHTNQHRRRTLWFGLELEEIQCLQFIRLGRYHNLLHERAPL